MEKTPRSLPTPEASIERTILIADQDENTVCTGKYCDAVARLPLKPQERYKFIRSIGFGGMKGVLLVHDADTGRDIAMAIMPDFRERPRRDLNRFVREAHITAQLEHPNIVPVHDIGVDASGSPFFTMKYLPGQSLAVILRQKYSGKETGYTRLRLLQVLIRVCNAVAFAHSKDICHLDLKPANIHCGEFGEVQVLDWGLAAAGDDDFDKGLLQGTPGYMAPEFINGKGKKRPGKAADIYAVGAILYAILSEEAPFSGLSQQEILRRTAAGKIKPLINHTEPVGLGLEAVCMKALSADPEDRYSSIMELRQEIMACINGFPTQAENASKWRIAMLYIRRHTAAIIIFLLLMLVMLLAFLLLVFIY